VVGNPVVAQKTALWEAKDVSKLGVGKMSQSMLRSIGALAFAERFSTFGLALVPQTWVTPRLATIPPLRGPFETQDKLALKGRVQEKGGPLRSG
jgi:hypothetical protein